MNQKKILILLAFSLCLNAGFLITALVGHGPSEVPKKKHPLRAYSRHLDLLKGLDLSDATFAQAKELLDDFMEQRTALVIQKLDHKLETVALLEKNPRLSRAELEARHVKEERIEDAISALGMDHTMDMRKILPPDKMAQLYTNAGELIRGHRDRMIHWKETSD